MTRRVGLLGGTFDPVHLGHLIAAEGVRVQLGLEKVLFIPARQSPLKQDQWASPVEHRLAMVELAVATNPYFAVSQVEIERGIPSYTVETVRYLMEEAGPSVSFDFLIGLDQAGGLGHWKDPGRLMELCQLVVMSRPGWPPLDFLALESFVPHARERIVQVEVPAIAISSTEVRRRVAQGLSIKYLVPETVEEYILSHRLYASDPGAPQ